MIERNNSYFIILFYLFLVVQYGLRIVAEFLFSLQAQSEYQVEGIKNEESTALDI